ncbi:MULTISPECIES: GntR family transcriptional regulator [Clostridioides]|uniref:GntR family transcriptional regulator n=1 Tax=unclassified Clostridioides TaxID=2635829 RepID=UPI001D0CD324|nr:GntR family transcriptional regulator [Clostridioides sp. ZZV15-6388]MCC0636631.1 GntR family transcriptional regulator [Clostridioides sp. ES-S-0001-02]MCC0640220.1 GntR family transcriptional regulator [Clostridioides sp. ES-S-0049-03]MCC0650056.1 GntR family transcriptional regulator [Clostridioides sp. ZZV15-6598]MCC0651999.1 GntR family transcriptional regulator [Clostridioides sp. ES-S-0001-03]MCC0657804.1 GntR family transcriptional regulator [Clostridioides sp. ES-S-0123-01]MCC0659
MKLILNNEEPIFIQIARAIEDEILSDGIKEEEQVPSTTELSKLYKINPATVLKGINTLVDKNILYKKRGIGMFVSEGARSIIKEVRKENFKNNFIKNLLQEADKLEINREELVDIIINFKGE